MMIRAVFKNLITFTILKKKSPINYFFKLSRKTFRGKKKREN